MTRHLFGRKGTDNLAMSTYESMEERSAKYSKEIQDLNEKIMNLTKQIKDPANAAKVQLLKRKAMDYIKRRKTIEFLYNNLQSKQAAVTQIAFIKTVQDATNGDQQQKPVAKSNMKSVTIEDWNNSVVEDPKILSIVNEISDVLSGYAKVVETQELDNEYTTIENELTLRPPSLSGLVTETH